MYQSYHSTKWPIVPATILTARRGFGTSGSPEGSGLPRASCEVFIELSIFSRFLRRTYWNIPGHLKVRVSPGCNSPRRDNNQGQEPAQRLGAACLAVGKKLIQHLPGK